MNIKNFFKELKLAFIRFIKDYFFKKIKMKSYCVKEKKTNRMC